MILREKGTGAVLKLEAVPGFPVRQKSAFIRG